MVPRRSLLGLTVGWMMLATLAQPLWGQSLRAPVAVSGEPFGVVVAELPVPAGLTVDRIRILVSDTQGRLFYPAVSVRSVDVVQPLAPLPGQFRQGGLVDRVRTVIRGEKTKRVPVAITVATLFRGAQPLQLQLRGDVNQRLDIPVTNQASLSAIDHPELLQEWWRVYRAQADRAEQAGDHPLLMHKYLVHSLASRLQLPLATDSDESSSKGKSKENQLAEPLSTLALLAAIEPLRDQILDEVMHGSVSTVEASAELPQAPVWQQSILPPLPSEVPLESLAERVPPECFYLRFGSFANYLWFQDLSSRNAGDLAQIVLVRGFNYETSIRMERMLNTRMTMVSKMFGDQIISDMAIIGRDLYMKEGASLGVVFATKNRSLLLSSLESERKQATQKIPGATLQSLEIAGQTVSLLSTPDNRIRSFLVGDGDYVFLTTSRHLAERFLQVSASGESLAAQPGFRWARVWMPAANNYSVFAYFSPEFFHGLVSPQFQIELRRRLEAIAHLEVAEVATRVAEAEGVAVDVPSMSRAGLLPQSFDERPDGARTLRDKQRWIDSLRGARGSFLPIVDVEVGQVTAAEARRYRDLAAFYQSQWQQMDPMLVGLRRFKVEGDSQAEKIGIEAYIAPFGKEKYGWLADMLAPASPVALASPGDDVVSLQLLMNGTAPLLSAREPYHLFAGVRDMVPPAPGEVQGLIQTLFALKALPAYLGAYPSPGYLDQLPMGLSGRPDAAGFSRSLIGLWRWQASGFSLLSFDRSIIESVIPTLQTVKADDAAQARLQIRNLTGSKLSAWINQQWYARAARASHGNASLLDAIEQQLRVPGSEALQVAESMFDVRLNCPLGGQFAYTPQPSNAKVSWWTSTAWSKEKLGPDGTPQAPDDYLAPWLKWFRGAKLHLTQFPDRLVVVGTADVERQPLVNSSAEADVALPPMNFDLFQLPFNIFGGNGDQAAPNKPAKPEKRSF